MKDFKIVAGKTGATTKLFVDGVEVGNCMEVVFRASSRGVNEVTLTLLPESVIIENQEPEAIKLKVKRQKIKAK